MDQHVLNITALQGSHLLSTEGGFVRWPSGQGGAAGRLGDWAGGVHWEVGRRVHSGGIPGMEMEWEFGTANKLAFS